MLTWLSWQILMKRHPVLSVLLNNEVRRLQIFHNKNLQLANTCIILAPTLDWHLTNPGRKCWILKKLLKLIFANYSCSFPSHGNLLQLGGRTRQRIVETANTRLCTGKIGEPTTAEKKDRSSCVGVGKDPGRHSVA